jgi:hypothetical protein
MITRLLVEEAGEGVRRGTAGPGASRVGKRFGSAVRVRPIGKGERRSVRWRTGTGAQAHAAPQRRAQHGTAPQRLAPLAAHRARRQRGVGEADRELIDESSCSSTAAPVCCGSSSS